MLRTPQTGIVDQKCDWKKRVTSNAKKEAMLTGNFAEERVLQKGIHVVQKCTKIFRRAHDRET